MLRFRNFVGLIECGRFATVQENIFYVLLLRKHYSFFRWHEQKTPGIHTHTQNSASNLIDSNSIEHGMDISNNCEAYIENHSMYK